MQKDRTPLLPEDYIEPRCTLCEEPYGMVPEVKPVPQQRIIEKMDEYMSRRDYAGAERHLLYWLTEAELGHDLRGQLMLRNELAGHYRKTGNRDRAVQNAEEAIALVGRMDFGGTISAGTTYVNAATVYEAFGEKERAMELFWKAQAVYEAVPGIKAELLGGLYNNMALNCVSRRDFRTAEALYRKAMDCMARVPGGVLEQAITCLNMANAVEDEFGMEDGEKQITELLDRAETLLDSPEAPRNGYYAFVLEKCVPTFSYYGYFAAADTFTKRAEEIYRENQDRGNVQS